MYFRSKSAIFTIPKSAVFTIHAIQNSAVHDMKLYIVQMTPGKTETIVPAAVKADT